MGNYIENHFASIFLMIVVLFYIYLKGSGKWDMIMIIIKEPNLGTNPATKPEAGGTGSIDKGGGGGW